MTDLVSNETIAEITQTFWGAFLPDDGDLVPTAALPPVEDIRGRVTIGGAWKGTVEVSCSFAAARRVAASMFSAPTGSLSDADVADAVGELANVVGGNIKSILPPPTELSTPTVDGDGDWRFASELQSEVTLLSAGEPVVVRLWQDRA